LEAKKYDVNHAKYFKLLKTPCNFDFSKFVFYYEDYKIYKSHMKRIKEWFPEIKKTNTKDMILHLRLENRIIWKTHYINAVPIDVYKKVIKSNFEFEKLYIVSDAEKWEYVDEKDIKKIRKKISKKYSRNPTELIPIKKSIKYMNNFVDGLREFNPILHHSNKFIDDFNFIRSFDKILFKNSTFFNSYCSFLYILKTLRY